MQAALDELVTLLALEPIEVNIFRGRSPDENRQRVFGGQVAGQALVAAARTVDDASRLVHSLHAYFLRPGDPTVPILYEVDRLRDGRSFTTRRVVAIQHGRAIFNLQASFHTPEPGPDHQITMPPGLPDPESLPDWHTRMAPYKDQMGEWYDRPRPIDVRYIDGDPMSRKGMPSDGQRVWLRADGAARRPGRPRLHRDLRQRHVPARHDGPAVRPGLGQPGHADGQPRPRDVVPPRLPRRRVAAVRPARPVDGIGARPRRRGDLRRRRPARRQRRPRGPGTRRQRPDEAPLPDRRRGRAGDGRRVVRAATTTTRPPTTRVATAGPATTATATPAPASHGHGGRDRAPPAPSTTAAGHDGASRRAPTAAGAVPMTGNEPSVTLTEIGSFDAPVDLAWRAGDDAVYVVEQGGTIQRLLGDDDDDRARHL